MQMVFSSAVFLFGFLPLVLFVYYAVPKRFITARNIALMVSSLFFYAWGEPVWVVLLIISAITDYSCGMAINAAKSAAAKRAALVVSLCLNLSLLAVFKYLDFFLQNMGLLLRQEVALPGLALPIGISFYTFQTLSYTIDVYRGKAGVQRSFLTFLMYVSLFPQLVAGPIVRYQTIEHELTRRGIDTAQFSRGIERFIIGLSKKMLLANPIGVIAGDIFAADALTLSAGTAWLGALSWALQLFFDFAGYSDMAIGLGLMFGFHFEENFKYPYISRSVTEFWQRWHISLSTWFRDYVYIPLGGNRKGKRRQALNLLIVWALTGLWHGAAWNCVFWGLYFGVLLILEKFVWGRLLNRLPGFLRVCYALPLAVIGMMFLNANGMSHIWDYLRALFGGGSGYFHDEISYISNYRFELFFAVLFCTPAAAALGGRMRRTALTDTLRLAGLLAVFALSVTAVVDSSFNPFIYFRF